MRTLPNAMMHHLKAQDLFNVFAAAAAERVEEETEWIH